MGRNNSRLVDIEDIGRLCYENPDKLFYADVDYKGVKYRCGVEFDEEGQRIFLTRDIAPKGYHIEGVLFSGDDETKFGLNLTYQMMEERDLTLSYSNDCITYDKIISLSQREHLPDKLRLFVEEVVNASAEVDGLILKYIASRPKKLPSKFRKYLKEAI